ncbi:uncharacterized protein LOC135483642 [Lineus longissimus]|uniref:uncharacterized protein LOC135483642 n=1 Tax=Lineus longissimus TaxID=88925 RepID=UPI002B4EF85B
MPVDLSGKWKVKSTDDNIDELMTKLGFPAEVIEYMKTKLSFESKYTGDDYETKYTTPHGNVKVVTGTIGKQVDEKDFIGRPYSSMTKWEGDKLVTEMSFTDASLPRTRATRELKGDTLVTATTLVDSGLTAVTVFERC